MLYASKRNISRRCGGWWCMARPNGGTTITPRNSDSLLLGILGTWCHVEHRCAKVFDNWWCILNEDDISLNEKILHAERLKRISSEDSPVNFQVNFSLKFKENYNLSNVNVTFISLKLGFCQSRVVLKKLAEEYDFIPFRFLFLSLFFSPFLLKYSAFEKVFHFLSFTYDTI